MKKIVLNKRFEFDQKAIILTMRWLVVLLVIFMAVYSAKGFDYLSPNYILAMVIVAMNSVVSLFPPKFFERPWFTYMLFVADIAFVSAMIYFAEGINTDFYLVYFLSIFMSSIGRSVGGALPVAVVASVFYGWLVYRQSGLEAFSQPVFWLRMPFFFLIAIFSSFWAHQVERERRRKREVEDYNLRLAREIDMATEEIRRTSENYRTLKEYNENILASISTGVVVVDVGGTVTSINRRAAEIFSLPPAAALGKALSAVAPLAALREMLQKTLESGQPQQVQEIDFEGGGGRRTLEVSTSILHNQTARSNGAIAVISDVTEKRELEDRVRHSEKLAVLGEMAAVMAHEIRNPLNAIAGFAQLLQRRTGLDEKIHQQIGIIVHEAFRIDAIISDILDFVHQKKCVLKKIELEPILDRVAEHRRQAPGNKRVELSLRVEKPLPPIHGDADRIERVLANLVNNAWEAIEGEGRVEISVRRAAEERPGVVIAVSDNGCGIEPENLNKIFKPFFTTKTTGTGLGLAVIRRIVEEHGGRIEVDSRPGQGTNFQIYLPAQAA